MSEMTNAFVASSSNGEYLQNGTGYMNHEHTQFILWAVLADSFILLGRFKSLSRKHWYNIHGFGVLLIIIVSFVFSKNENKYRQIPEWDMRSIAAIHKNLGRLAFLAMLAMAFFGLFLRFLIVMKSNISNWAIFASVNITGLRRMHFIAGVGFWALKTLIILSGTYIYQSTFGGFFFYFVIAETSIFTCLFLFLEYRKRQSFSEGSKAWVESIPKLCASKEDIMQDLLNHWYTAAFLQEKYPDRLVVLLQNRVYELPADFVHPGGQWILNQVRFRDVGRFLYGMVPLESSLNHQWTHSAGAFEILNMNCIGDLSDYVSPGRSILRQSKDSTATVSKDDWVLQEKVNRPDSLTKMFKFTNKNYKICMDQEGTAWMGKHYVLSDKSGKKRYYTNCTSMTEEWQDYKELMILYLEKFSEDVHGRNPVPLLPNYIDYLPLLIKEYKGEDPLSRRIHQAKPSDLFHIEGPVGRGLEIDQFVKGSVVLISGGNGYIPFIDLISLLYIKALWLSIPDSPNNAPFTKEKQRQENLFKDTKFVLLCAFHSMADFFNYKNVLHLHKLCKENRLNFFECLIKLPDAKEMISLPATSDRFTGQTLKARIPENTEAVLISAPPQMIREVTDSLIADCSIPAKKIIYV